MTFIILTLSYIFTSSCNSDERAREPSEKSLLVCVVKLWARLGHFPPTPIRQQAAQALARASKALAQYHTWHSSIGSIYDYY